MNQNDYLKKIGTNIDSIRKKKNLTVKQLADGVEMERSNLSPILRGRNNVTALTIYKLAKFLEVSPKDFFVNLF